MPYAPGIHNGTFNCKHILHFIRVLLYMFKNNYPILSLSVVDIQSTMYIQLNIIRCLSIDNVTRNLSNERSCALLKQCVLFNCFLRRTAKYIPNIHVYTYTSGHSLTARNHSLDKLIGVL